MTDCDRSACRRCSTMLRAGVASIPGSFGPKRVETQRAFFLTCSTAVIWLTFRLALTILNGTLPALSGGAA